MQLFNKSTQPKANRSITGEIESTQSEIQAKQGVLDELLAQQSELALLITQHQQQIESSAQKLEQLEIREAQEKREAEIAAELQQLRPLADTVNRLSSELAEALDKYQNRSCDLKQQRGLYGFIEAESRLTELVLPEIKHTIGSQHFTLKARNITVKR